MEGQEVVDNILLAQELISGMGFKIWGENVAIKVDMEKAYDK